MLAGRAAHRRAEDEKPTGDFSVSVLSQYIWRGYELSRSSVVIQPSAVAAILPIKVTDRITITPMLTYICPLTSDARYEMKGSGLKGSATPEERDGSFLVGGVTFSFSF